MTSFAQKLTASCHNKQTKCKRTSSQTNWVKVQPIFPSPTGQGRQIQAKWLPLHPREKPERGGVEGSPGCNARVPYPTSESTDWQKFVHDFSQQPGKPTEHRSQQLPGTHPPESQGRGSGPRTLSPNLLCSRINRSMIQEVTC